MPNPRPPRGAIARRKTGVLLNALCARLPLAFALAGACLFAHVPATRAGDGEACVAYAPVLDAAMEASAKLPGSNAQEYDGRDARAIVDVLNDLFQFDLVADRVLVFEYPEGTFEPLRHRPVGAKIALSLGGCVFAARPVGAEIWKTIRRRAIGDPA
ncbi:MAG: hypothetical protein ABR878_01680 [Roseiarcus sp.]|jgi:hypothetical protein